MLFFSLGYNLFYCSFLFSIFLFYFLIFLITVLLFYLILFLFSILPSDLYSLFVSRFLSLSFFSDSLTSQPHLWNNKREVYHDILLSCDLAPPPPPLQKKYRRTSTCPIEKSKGMKREPLLLYQLRWGGGRGTHKTAKMRVGLF